MARRWEPADTVVALSTALLLTIFSILGVLVWRAYEDNLREAEVSAQKGADIVANQAQWIVGSSLLLLNQLALDMRGNPANATEATRNGLNGAVELPTGASLAVYDATGDVAPNGRSPSLPDSVAGTRFFDALAAGADWSISSQHPDAADGSPMFVIAKRLGGAEAFRGTVAITIRGRILETIWNLEDLGRDSTVSILRDDGWIVARYPPLNEAMQVTGGPIFDSSDTGDGGTYHSAASPADGVARIVGFRRIPELGLIAIASVSRDEVWARMLYGVTVVSLLLAPIALALFGGSFLTARLLRQGERTRRTLEAAVAHNEVLFREIHHRVKNNLQSVSALLQLQPIPREIKLDMGQRLAAMSAVHEHIYRTSSFTTVRVREYLSTLIQNIRDAQDSAVAVAVAEEIEDLAVDKDTAGPLGLILNEVVTNAFKHAFTDGRAGRVTVTVTRDADGQGRLSIEDNGVGFDPAKNSRGIGRRLIAALTEQIRGQSSFAGNTGSRFTLTFPLAD